VLVGVGECGWVGVGVFINTHYVYYVQSIDYGAIKKQLVNESVRYSVKNSIIRAVCYRLRFDLQRF